METLLNKSNDAVPLGLTVEWLEKIHTHTSSVHDHGLDFEKVGHFMQKKIKMLKMFHNSNHH